MAFIDDVRKTIAEKDEYTQARMLEKWARLFVYHDLRQTKGRTAAEVSRREFYFVDRRRSGGLVDPTQPYLVGEIPSDRELSPPIVTPIRREE